ncbi:MAG: hypothetical protein ACI9KE_003319 [Polyangiales bacterium]|jgi:hypothetical protein
MASWSRLLGLALLPAVLGCTADLPPLTIVFGVDWEEAPTIVDGEEQWRTYRLESDSLVVTQHCGETEVEAVVPASHRYIVYVTRPVSVNTVVGGDNCMASYSMVGSELALDADGQGVRTIGRTEGTVLQPYTEVNGLFGGRSFVNDDGATIEWYFTPTTIETVARCPNNLSATVTVPVDLEHYFEIEATEGVTRTEGSCELIVESGVYRYFPDAGALELGLAFVSADAPEIRLTRE